MIRIFLIFMLAGLVVSCGNDDTTLKQRFLIRGNNALAERNYREAQRLFQEALKIDSCYLPALNNLGILRFEQKQYIQAIRAYDAALACDPEDYQAILNRTNAYYETNQLYRAEADLDYLLKQHPDSSTLYFRIGLVHARLHNYPRAILDFSKAVDMDSVNTEALINRGSTYYYLGEYDKAKKDLNRAMETGVQPGNIYNALALISVEEGELELALEQIESALLKEPLQPYFLNNRGFIHLLRGNVEQAREDIDQSIALDPENAWAYRNKGRWYHQKAMYEDALRLYDLALTKDTFIQDIFIYRGDTYMAMGKNDLACIEYAKAAENANRLAPERLRMCE